ncbi:MAG: hypothetical protein GY773_23490, partial [Actinomycetia bacterium]|nr:hypothetical protein [Actinomycetes bacterium]
MAPTALGSELPASVPNWPELDEGDVVGFRPAEACDLAAAWFPRISTVETIDRAVLTPSMEALNDGSGRAVDTETGELVKLISGQEVAAGKAVKLRRLVIGPGKVAVECGQISNAERTLARIDAQLEMDQFLDDQAKGMETDTMIDDEGRPWNVVTEFSRKARQRLRQRVAEVDWYEPLQRTRTRIGMITLTYARNWEHLAPDPDTVTTHRHQLERRMERALGYLPPFFWVREFRHRGAPHFHFAGVFPTRINGERLETRLSRNWYEIVGSGDARHLKAGTGVDWSEG